MIALTATALPELAAVRLDVTGAASTITLTRSDANGSREVRLHSAVTTGGALTATDYEPALSGAEVRYTVTDDDGYQETATVAMNVGHPWIHVPTDPRFRKRLLSVLDYSAGRDSAASVHWLIDRGDPVVVSGPARTREGSLSVLTTSHMEAVQVQDVADASTVMVRTTDHGDLDFYGVITRSSVTPSGENTSPRRWIVTLDFSETRPPSGDLGPEWTIDDVAASAFTIDDIAYDYETVFKLVVGP